jgi:hypothetical protein
MAMLPKHSCRSICTAPIASLLVRQMTMTVAPSRGSLALTTSFTGFTSYRGNPDKRGLRTPSIPRNCTETGSFIHFNTPITTASCFSNRPAGTDWLQTAVVQEIADDLGLKVIVFDDEDLRPVPRRVVTRALCVRAADPTLLLAHDLPRAIRADPANWMIHTSLPVPRELLHARMQRPRA